jgi:hypothetical protein
MVSADGVIALGTVLVPMNCAPLLASLTTDPCEL